MELQATIHRALDLTRRLVETLQDREQSLVDQLLEQRGQAMANFDRTHQEASAREKSDCGAEIQALANADQLLQKRAQELLTQVMAESREQLGMSAHRPNQNSEYGVQACLDRKA